MGRRRWFVVALAPLLSHLRITFAHCVMLSSLFPGPSTIPDRKMVGLLSWLNEKTRMLKLAEREGRRRLRTQACRPQYWTTLVLPLRIQILSATSSRAVLK